MRIQPISIYRGTYDSTLNYFHGEERAGMAHPQGFMKPEECSLKFLRIIKHPAGEQYGLIAVPVDENGDEIVKPGHTRQFGGTYVACSDSRYREVVGFGVGATPLHDRFEPCGR